MSIDWTKPIRVNYCGLLSPARLLADNRRCSVGYSHVIMDDDGDIYFADERGRCPEHKSVTIENVPPESFVYLRAYQTESGMLCVDSHPTLDKARHNLLPETLLLKLTVRGGKAFLETVEEWR